ncbi:hypothetical protein RFI_12772 [Reticulomyxa filosa]|uniref:Uncharacterized protein n=1 Tax=Reticulomyxa filosa TaxID=46433 RepID=X6NF89_RETFI|nr:hypothetical protein RFI_12772 [Reticulomyxa filosa]|eukprot:ETO24384.1 hypothetical protein RFI_12772 [Reticulomyxa filosa]
MYVFFNKCSWQFRASSIDFCPKVFDAIPFAFLQEEHAKQNQKKKKKVDRIRIVTNKQKLATQLRVHKKWIYLYCMIALVSLSLSVLIISFEMTAKLGTFESVSTEDDSDKKSRPNVIRPLKVQTVKKKKTMGFGMTTTKTTKTTAGISQAETNETHVHFYNDAPF